MARIPRATLRPWRVPILRAQLEGLVARTTLETRDPVQFVKRYACPQDAEVAAVFAATLAFGRLEAFMPVIAAVLERADAHGGPAAWVDNFDSNKADELAPLLYRWIRAHDLALLAQSIGEMRAKHGSVREVFQSAHQADHTDLGQALDHFINTLRSIAVGITNSAQYSDLTRGFRHSLPRPSDGSGCKRWNMLLRWMVRTPTHPGDPDLGLWDLPRHKLLIPVDTHVLKVARLIGLTHRTDGSWRTAQEITQNLARIHPEDPVRYDFALAHLGISGGCKARHIAEICTPCPLRACCRHGRVSKPPGGKP